MHQVSRVINIIAAIAGATGLAACADPADLGTSSQELVASYQGFDSGRNANQPRPQTDAARASFEAAAGGAANLSRYDFEAVATGTFVTRTIGTGVTVTLAGAPGDTAIVSGEATRTLGYNTTAGGNRFLRMNPLPPANSSMTAQFTFESPIGAFGANFTGIGSVAGGLVQMQFDDGSQQTFTLTGGSDGGVGFFGFIDPGRNITVVTIRESWGDIPDLFGIDDITTAPPVANQAPVALCADVTVGPDTTCHGTATIDAGSSDPEGDAVSCVQSPAGPYGVGATAVTLTCTDPVGLSASCAATVTVADASAPFLECPADRTVECNDGQGGARATFSAFAADSCDATPTLACQPPSGSTFPLGDTDGTCTATDDSGNTSTCSHTVTVADRAAPVVTGRSVAPLWPANHKYRRVDLAQCIRAIDDACTGPLTVAASTEITCCSADEAEDDDGDGSTRNDCVIVDHDSVDLRAERSGGGNGRVYTIAYNVTDQSGNVTAATCQVGVPASANGGAAIDDGARSCGTGVP